MTFSGAETALIIAGLRTLQRRGVDAEEMVIVEAEDVDLSALDSAVDELVMRVQYPDDEHKPRG